MAIARSLGAALGAALLAGCGPGDVPAPSGRAMGEAATSADAPRPHDENAPPVVARVELEPERPRPGDRLRARVEALDPDGDPVRLRYAWTVEGRGVPARGGELELARFARGTRIEVSVVASDGRSESAPASADATVANQPPRVLRVAIEPTGGGALPAELVAAVEVSEPEGDPVELDYAWSVGGRPVEARGPRLAARGIPRGEAVAVRVVASDGEDRSEPFESASVTLGNRPPEIARERLTFAPDGAIRHAVAASDPDGDRGLRFWLSQAPEGAEIDAVLGELSWRPTRKQVGTHVFEVAVSDGHGGEARQQYEVTVTEVVGKKRAASSSDANPPAALDETP